MVHLTVLSNTVAVEKVSVWGSFLVDIFENEIVGFYENLAVVL